jgi:hypothetical protein
MSSQTEQWLMLAADELTQYSTTARKIEKLRRKMALTLSPEQRQALKAELLADLPDNPVANLVANQRQTVALPLWGIAGLGLLFGISLQQPIDFLGTAIALPLAILVQRWGWELEAKQLVLLTLEDLDARSQQPQTE